MLNSKWKNYGLWVSIFSLIGLVLGNYGLYVKLGLTQESYKQMVDALFVVLVSAGIISSPTSGSGYTDKVEETTNQETK